MDAQVKKKKRILIKDPNRQLGYFPACHCFLPVPKVRYCGEVLSWMAECFSQSTLKCGKDAPRAPSKTESQKHDIQYVTIKEIVQFCSRCKRWCDFIFFFSVSLAGSKSTSSKDAPQGPNKEDKAKAGQPGYGANKTFPYIDE